MCLNNFQFPPHRYICVFRSCPAPTQFRFPVVFCMDRRTSPLRPVQTGPISRLYSHRQGQVGSSPPPDKGARALSPKLVPIYCQENITHSCNLPPSRFFISGCLIKHKDSLSIHMYQPNTSRLLQIIYLAESLRLLSELQTDTSDKAHYHICGIQ